MFGSSLSPDLFRRAHLSFTLIVFVLLAHSGIQHILCCVFVLFFLVLCTMCYQFLWIVQCLLLFSSSCVQCVTSFSGLSSVHCSFSIFLVLCTMCYQFLWIVQCSLLLQYFPRLVYNVLPVSLDCPVLIAPSVFSLSCVLYTICYQFLWIVQCSLLLQYFPRLVYNVLPVSLDCPFLIAPSVFSLSCVLYTICYQFLWIVHF